MSKTSISAFFKGTFYFENKEIRCLESQLKHWNDFSRVDENNVVTEAEITCFDIKAAFRGKTKFLYALAGNGLRLISHFIFIGE